MILKGARFWVIEGYGIRGVVYFWNSTDTVTCEAVNMGGETVANHGTDTKHSVILYECLRTSAFSKVFDNEDFGVALTEVLRSRERNLSSTFPEVLPCASTSARGVFILRNFIPIPFSAIKAIHNKRLFSCKGEGGYFLGIEAIGRGSLVRQQPSDHKNSFPTFLCSGGGFHQPLPETTEPLYCTIISPTSYRALSAMSTLPAEHGGSSLRVDSRHCGISDTRTGHNLTNNIHNYSNTNVGNVSNSYNTINVGVGEEPSRIEAWLSPLDFDRRHRDVSNRRLDGVGDWVLRRNEFESWHRGRDGSRDPTLLCYGSQGVGKTFIRYRGNLEQR